MVLVKPNRPRANATTKLTDMKTGMRTQWKVDESRRMITDGGVISVSRKWCYMYVYAIAKVS